MGDAAAAASEAPRPRRFVGRRRKDAATAAPGEAPASSRTELARRARAGAGKSRSLALSQVPDEIANDPELKHAMSQLPANYNFQVAKTVWRLKRAGARRVALQLPEGLLLFACVLADIFEQCAGVEEALVMADVTYGACCIDDYSARALGCDFMVHYGHSCLVPIDITAKENAFGEKLQVMYVFVDIDIDVEHLVECVKLTFPDRGNTRLALMGTIQFAAAMHRAKTLLDAHYPRGSHVPQAKPLSRGEVLGCTSPSLAGEAVDAFVFVADGRFHLESAMIANPEIPAYRYNPYDRVLTHEAYDTPLMRKVRRGEIEKAQGAKRWAIVLGTLGRQGNPAILRRIEALLKKHGREHFVLLMSEVFPAKLALLESSVDAWVQIACPRLSIDWGEAFSKPLLTPYECFVAFGEAEWREVYPQDFYSKGSGPWTNFHEEKYDDDKSEQVATKQEPAM
ncbi:2-3-amino-3-carboxypropylhistidine synthase subunit 1 [Hondaea fermentalgiana]|uniref:2-(3-amino-3-carboxypropyl)histidine synthase subunit 1 n=1 Tax=Hondaea fermentalgiana TaxID=2315210 RepID=A0A2R5GM06_9STRA|nr:2-3-amino-3-carboxypropylhistidine synthase subunit 1 [Hondaea fermentalgiana]|eukprot:GBG31349.1 2-3-amino-3-carboxypropylhistidine synthase subunit 1 [Hondaea fermentalgiana]